MPDEIKPKFSGLFLQPNDMASVPDGALAVADNKVLSRDDILETRRGFERIATKGITRIFPFKSGFIGWGNNVLSHSADGVTWTDFTTDISQPTDAPVRASLASRDLFLTAEDATYRVDSLTSEPVKAGFGAPTFGFSSTTPGSAVQPDAAVAYRAVVGTRDSAGRVILGPPSGRTVSVNSGTTPVSLVRTAGTTVTVTFASQPGIYNQATIYVIGDDANFPPGSKSATWTTTTTCTYTEAGANATASGAYRVALPAFNFSANLIIPDDAGSPTFAQLYRSLNTVGSDVSPSDDLQLATEITIPSGITIVSQSRTAGVVTATTAAPHGLTALAMGVYIASGSAAFPPFLGVVASTPTSTTFTYSDTLSALSGSGSESVQRSAVVRSILVTDSATDDLLGAFLYSSPSQETLLASNYPPPACRDIASFRGSAFYANQTTPASLDVQLLGVPLNGDTVQVGGYTYTFQQSGTPTAWFVTFSTAAGNFNSPFSTAGTIAQTIAAAAQALVAAINLNPYGGVTAYYASGEADIPGRIRLTGRDASSSIAFGPASRPSFWSPGYTATVSPAEAQHRLSYSKLQQPDAVPVTNSIEVGSEDYAIKRVAATRDSLFILKDTEGVWRLTGTNAADFRLDPFDYNTHVFAPETAFVLDNKIFLLTEQGVAAITDTGVELVSRAIETALFPLMVGELATVTRDLAFAVGVESARKYILFLPSAATDTVCTQAYVYDLVTQGWTRWTLSGVHALSNPTDDRVYLVDGTYVRQERKNLDDTDFADESYSLTVTDTSTTGQVTVSDASSVGVGDAIVQGDEWAVVTGISGNVLTISRTPGFTVGAATLGYRAIPTAVEPVPKFSPPGMYHLFKQVVLSFRDAVVAFASLTFSTDVDTTEESVNFTPEWSGDQDHPTVRITVPRNKARGSWLRLRWEHTEAWSPDRMQAISVEFEPGTSPVVTRRQPKTTVLSGMLGSPLGSRLGGW